MEEYSDTYSSSKKLKSDVCTRKEGTLCPGESAVKSTRQQSCRSVSCPPQFKAASIQWCNREMACDDVGPGIRQKVGPESKNLESRKDCCSPKFYGKLASNILTNEVWVEQDTNGPPPCSICEILIPPCCGYYRPYKCIKPDEGQFIENKLGKPVLNDKAKRYWEPCDDTFTKKEHVAEFDCMNVNLLKKLRSKQNSCSW